MSAKEDDMAVTVSELLSKRSPGEFNAALERLRSGGCVVCNRTIAPGEPVMMMVDGGLVHDNNACTRADRERQVRVPDAEAILANLEVANWKRRR